MHDEICRKESIYSIISKISEIHKSDKIHVNNKPKQLTPHADWPKHLKITKTKGTKENQIDAGPCEIKS